MEDVRACPEQNASARACERLLNCSLAVFKLVTVKYLARITYPAFSFYSQLFVHQILVLFFDSMGDDQSLKSKAQQKLKSGNASQLGDPVSLKAETSERVPKEGEEGAKTNEHKTLKEVAQETNPSMLGDPISLKAETEDYKPSAKEEGGFKRQSKI